VDYEHENPLYQPSSIPILVSKHRNWPKSFTNTGFYPFKLKCWSRRSLCRYTVWVSVTVSKPNVGGLGNCSIYDDFTNQTILRTYKLYLMQYTAICMLSTSPTTERYSLEKKREIHNRHTDVRSLSQKSNLGNKFVIRMRGHLASSRLLNILKYIRKQR
jgi:hypothetical protein